MPHKPYGWRTVPGSSPSQGPPLAAAAPAMSLVLAAASSQYVTQTWGNSPTNANIATISFFIKRSSDQAAFAQLYDSGDYLNNNTSTSGGDFNGSDIIRQVVFTGGIVNDFESINTITDTTTWHHILYQLDSTQATGTNRTHIYLDGTEVTYSLQSPIIAQNNSFHLTDSGITSAIGRLQFVAGRYLDAKLAYYYLIDGQALTPSSFTTGTGAGTTHPKTYTGSFGTNGFFLNFTGSNTNDQSGNSNNWTPQNSPTFSTDVPT